jgi:hypothetical protein
MAKPYGNELNPENIVRQIWVAENTSINYNNNG